MKLIKTKSLDNPIQMHILSSMGYTGADQWYSISRASNSFGIWFNGLFMSQEFVKDKHITPPSLTGYDKLTYLSFIYKLTQ